MSKWGLSKKIWAVLSLLVLAFVGSVYLALSRMSDIRDNLNEITSLVVKRDQLSSQIQDLQRQMVITSDEIILVSSDDAMLELQKKFEDLVTEQNKVVDTYEAIASEKGKELARLYSNEQDNWIVEVRKAQKLTLDKHDEQAWQALEIAKPIRLKMLGYIADMKQLTAKALVDKSAEANAMASQAIMLTLVISAVSIVVSLIIAYFVLRATTNAINAVVRNLFDGAAQVTSASSQIASSSEELSQATTEQAASLEQTAASIEEMNSMVAKNSENAGNTAKTSQDSQHKAAQGKEVVVKMIQSMDAINESNNTIMTQINRSNDQFSEIAKVIEEIGNKTKVINDIVFQTRLLSFNASVEAARAGEHGKGFAVVAEEVGNLAQMSGNAAKEISSMLEGSIQRVNSIVHETKESVAKLVAEGKTTVEAGAAVARQCGEVLDEIVHNVASVSNMANEIAQASQEQARGVTEITRAMNQLDTVTQQNAATSEEAASASEELSAQAESMKNAVGHLVAVIEGGDGSSQGAFIAPARSASDPKRSHAVKSKKSEDTKVLHLKPRESAPQDLSEDRFKKVSGDSVAPAYDDKRFKDI